MTDSTVVHTIKDNTLYITRHDGGNDLKEATALSVDKIIVGVENPDRREILKNPETGLNYSRTAVEAQEIYNKQMQAHRPWFLLELCTGKYGWYPGCVIKGDVLSVPVKVMTEPDDNSKVLYTIDELSTVEILDQDALDKEPFKTGWYKINFEQIGYIKSAYVFNLRYGNPNSAD